MCRVFWPDEAATGVSTSGPGLEAQPTKTKGTRTATAQSTLRQRKLLHMATDSPTKLTHADTIALGVPWDVLLRHRSSRLGARAPLSTRWRRLRDASSSTFCFILHSKGPKLRTLPRTRRMRSFFAIGCRSRLAGNSTLAPPAARAPAERFPEVSG